MSGWLVIDTAVYHKQSVLYWNFVLSFACRFSKLQLPLHFWYDFVHRALVIHFKPYFLIARLSWCDFCHAQLWITAVWYKAPTESSNQPQTLYTREKLPALFVNKKLYFCPWAVNLLWPLKFIPIKWFMYTWQLFYSKAFCSFMHFDSVSKN